MNEFNWAVAREIPHLRRYARSLVRDRDVADDLVQDCLERGLRKHHLWTRRGSLRSWLFRILYRTYLNDLRRPGAIREDVDSGATAEPGAAPPQEAVLHANDILQGLARLPDEQRAAILLIALEDVSYDDAAQILGIPIGTLRSRLWRGRAALRDYQETSPRQEAVALRRVK